MGLRKERIGLAKGISSTRYIVGDYREPPGSGKAAAVKKP
jgi:hypothetical protein